MKDQEGNEFSRKSLVLALANKEGGAHVDPESDDAYIAVVHSNSLGVHDVLPDGTFRPAESNPIFGSVRAISHEVIVSLKQQQALIT